jgi:hypothetical protein
MREKCTYADRYKAKYAPRCGCKACETKWAERHTCRLKPGWLLEDARRAAERFDELNLAERIQSFSTVV